MLDEALLRIAVQVFGVKTYSAAVNQALAESIRIKKLQQISKFVGQGIWEGDLSEMRSDAKIKKKKASTR